MRPRRNEDNDNKDNDNKDKDNKYSHKEGKKTNTTATKTATTKTTTMKTKTTKTTTRTTTTMNTKVQMVMSGHLRPADFVLTAKYNLGMLVIDREGSCPACQCMSDMFGDHVLWVSWGENWPAQPPKGRPVRHSSGSKPSRMACQALALTAGCRCRRGLQEAGDRFSPYDG